MSIQLKLQVNNLRRQEVNSSKTVQHLICAAFVVYGDILNKLCTDHGSGSFYEWAAAMFLSTKSKYCAVLLGIASDA